MADSVWGEENSQDFIDYGKYFVPDREVQIRCVCDAIPPATSGCILDLCCGEGLLTRALLETFPECQVYGFDGSPTMLAHIEDALAAYGHRFQAHHFDLAAKTWREFSSPVHAVVSSLAIHHLDATEKQELFRDIATLLRPGGSFIIADLTEPMNTFGKKLAADAWDAAVQQRARYLDGDLTGYEQFCALNWNHYRITEPDPHSIDKPSALFDQLKWLEAAGFTEVDVFWMKAGHAVFGGRKQVSSEDAHDA